MQKISEKDWKIYRKKLPGWQEAYMDRLCGEYIGILSSRESASSRFWALEERVRKDQKRTGVVADMRRSQMLFQLAELVGDGVIGLSDLDEFSDDVKEAVRMFVCR